jgi:PilZ domain
MDQERQGLRFPFIAAAEIAPEGSPSASITASVKELSLYGCYIDTPAPFAPKTSVLVKIFKSDQYFEAKATVIYAHPALGMGLAFRDVKPDFRIVMQKWLLAALQDKEPKP